MGEPFHFHSRLYLTELTGLKARDLRELLENLKTLPESSIYYHTHRFLQQHHYLSPEPPNDFAYWIRNILQEEELGERMASIDTVQFTSINALREKFIELIEDYTRRTGKNPDAPEGYEFHFMKAITFVIPTPHHASSLKEFYEVMQRISVHSIYYHMFEARLRLKRQTNDFSSWLEEQLGEKELAEKIDRLDPYTHTLEGLRKRILAIAKRRLDAQGR
ncbi:MAG TPA: DUF5752 family protein [Candidatus Brocadiales bacterium]|nr:DUF5752 family protein [Candidatus Brocadiales bacterium]